MRASVFVAALVGSAVATPVMVKRQEIDYEAIEAALDASDPVGAPVGGGSDAPDYNSDAAAAAVVADDGSAPSRLMARAQCTPLPKGSGPATSPDTASAFLANQVYTNTANANNKVPGYTLTFGPGNNATNSKTYLGYYSLTKYAPLECQRKCDDADSCMAFNIYFERGPSISMCDTKPDPPSTINIKCALFGGDVNAQSALNAGQYRNKFQVVHAGSQGFVKPAPPPAIDGFDGPSPYVGAINAPRADNSYLTQRFFAGPYNPKQCAAKCLEINDYNKKHPNADGTYKTCTFFNSYLISKNYVGQGTQCGFYTQSYLGALGKKYDTNYDQTRASGYWSNSLSYGYALKPAV